MRWILAAACWFAMMVVPAPAQTAPASQPATPAAEQLLADVRQAYANLKSLEVSGTISFDADVAARKESHKVRFTGSYRAPAKFRHESDADMLMVSDGQKAYAYKIDAKRYMLLEAPKDRVESAGELPSTLAQGLWQQNPSLLLALCKDAGATLAEDVKSLDRGADVTLEGTSYAALTYETDGQRVRILIDPKTHLVRQYTADLKGQLAGRGVPSVNSAVVTIDYATSAAGAEVADAAFSWSPPEEAMQVRPLDEATADGGSGSPEAGQVLTGKPAPDFVLKDLSGIEVSLEKLRGKVVVLDFWATWCGPCVASLPHIAALNKDLGGEDGAQIFAVNVAEAAPVVKRFLTERGLELPVLLDADGKVSRAYRAPPIPQTFVIDRDGKVRKVFVGYGPGMEVELRKAVEQAKAE